MTHLQGVPSDIVPVVWPHIAERVALSCKAVPEADDPEHYFAECSTANMQLWLCIHDEKLTGVLITSITGQRCRLELAQADCLEYAINELGTIAEWARGLGCNEIDMYGRKGWAKPFMRAGFRTKTVHLSRGI